MTGPEPLLSFQKVSLSFGGLNVLTDVNLEIREREIVSMIGPNGAGKTTIFNITTGIYQPNKGSVSFKKASLSKLASYEIAQIGITRTFQNIRLFKDLTVLQNVLIAAHQHYNYLAIESFLRTKRFLSEEKAFEQKSLELLGIFGLQSRSQELARNLPYGEQRKLEIVRALATGATLLLLDEPAAGMNDQETQGLMKLIQSIRDKFAVTILLIEHDMKLVMGISDRIVVLHHGVIIAEGKPEAIRNDPNVIEAYLGKPQ